MTTYTYQRWRAEKSAAFLSRIVSEAEEDPGRAGLFRRMAEAAEQQAALIGLELPHVPTFVPSLRARFIARLVRLFGPRFMRPVLAASKVRGLSVYSGPARRLGHPMPTSVKETGRSHRGAGGGTLRAGVFGANDGLVSNTCLVMGVAGAAAGPDVILPPAC